MSQVQERLPERVSSSRLYYYRPLLDFLSQWMTPPSSSVLKSETWMLSLTSIFPSPAWSMTKFCQLYPFNIFYIISTSSPSRLHHFSPVGTICCLVYISEAYLWFQSLLQAMPQRMWNHKSENAVPQPMLLLCPELFSSRFVPLMTIQLLSFIIQLMCLFIKKTFCFYLSRSGRSCPLLHPTVSWTYFFSTPVSSILETPSRLGCPLTYSV